MRALLFFVIFICSCSGPVVQKTEQNIFESSVLNLKDKISSSNNEIVEHNLIQAYFDSINSKHIPINNWIGNIKGIHQKSYELWEKEYISLEFDIIRKIDNCEISYSCLHLIPKDSLKYDSIYVKVLNMGNLDLIKFSGEFRENNPTPENYNSSYPKLNVKLSNIWKPKQ